MGVLEPTDDAAIHPSPRKKQKTDLKSSWQSAVDAMEEVDDELDFPAEPVFFPLIQEREKTEIMDTDTEVEEAWVPPGPDVFLTIPDHGVLCKDKASANTLYWPARIKEYVPPSKRGKKGLYLVMFLDKTEKKVPRDWFFDESQDEFATCKVRRIPCSTNTSCTDLLLAGL